MTKVFGLILLGLGAFLLFFISRGGINSAPLLIVFATLGAIGTVVMGIWSLIGRF